MQILTKSDIQKQLHSSHQVLKHALGQNYLVSQSAISAFLSHMDTSETVIEIGPGIGTITIQYFKKYQRVIAIELDKEKIPLLRENLTQANNGVYPDWVEIIHADVLSIDFIHDLSITGSYQIIGALPYNISKQIVRKTYLTLPHPTTATYILQREVADKYILQPDKNSFLAVSAALYAHLKRHEIIKRTNFTPVPKVDSRIVTISSYTYNTKEQLTTLNDINTFIRLLFQYPRKKIASHGKLIWPNKLTENMPKNIDKLLSLRPEKLTVNDWEHLYCYFKEK